MWVRKSEEERNIEKIQNRKSRWNPLWPALGGLFLGLFFTVLSYLGPLGLNGRPCSFSSPPSLTIAPIIFLSCFAFFFISIYLYRILTGRPAFEQKTMICNKCFAPKPYSKKKLCECGGQLEPLENWKWIE